LIRTNGGNMILNFAIKGTIKGDTLENIFIKLKNEFGEDFFNEHIVVDEEIVEDKGQKVDIE